jgi:hypothetical protein
MRSGAPGTPVVSGCGILEAAAFGDTSAAIGDINLRRASDQTTEESAGHPRRAYSRALAARPVSRLTGCLRPSYDSTEPSVWLPFASPLPLPAALYPARPQRAVSSDRRHLRGQWGGGGGSNLLLLPQLRVQHWRRRAQLRHRFRRLACVCADTFQRITVSRARPSLTGGPGERRDSRGGWARRGGGHDLPGAAVG